MWQYREHKPTDLSQFYERQFDQLNQKLDDLSKQISALLIGQEKNATAIVVNSDRLGLLEGTIYGNGTPGLKVRVNQLEQARSSAMWATGTLLGVGGTVLGAAIGALVRHFWP